LNTTELANISCPYCGEPIDIIVDCSIPTQEYIEDCQVCCQPITVVITINDDNRLTVTAQSELD
jgi:hypothetical protein